MSAEVAEAKSFFCKPAPINIGSYRPEDSSSELDISVNFPDASPFWFDDETGDYVSLNDGVVGPIVKKIVHLPLTLTNPKDKLTNAAVVAFAAGQCLPAEMGVFKQAPWP